MPFTNDSVDHRSPPAAKIALFRTLFRGREDVYPRRFESRKTGKAGYQPACANEWIRGVCEKPRIKCSDCPHQRFLAVTNDVIRWHLSGQDDEGKDFVMGIYPMLQDETCFVLAADLDGGAWRDDAKAFSAGRRTAPGKCRGLSPGSPQGPAASRGRLFRIAVPCRRRRQTSRHGDGHDPTDVVQPSKP
jgi:hypothetical protein